MTTPIPVPPTPTVPVYPALGSPNFNQEAYDYATAMPGVSTALGALAENAATNAQISHDNTITAIQASQAAQDARDAAQGAANFKGLWSSLSGPLNKPASVKHNNRIWLLLNNLPDVTASEPGVSSDWTTGDSGALIQVVTADTTIAPGVTYSVMTPGVTLTLPASLGVGDALSVQNSTAADIFVVWSGHTVKGQVPVSPMRIPRLRGFSVIYNGSTLA